MILVAVIHLAVYCFISRKTTISLPGNTKRMLDKLSFSLDIHLFSTLYKPKIFLMFKREFGIWYLFHKKCEQCSFLTHDNRPSSYLASDDCRIMTFEMSMNHCNSIRQSGYDNLSLNDLYVYVYSQLVFDVNVETL